jgi:hypothetical protein
MKRLTPLALIVLALAVVPAALADDGTTPAPAGAPAAQRAGHVPMRLEILRLRMQIVSLRFRLHCGPRGTASQDRCTAFAQNALDHLTALDGKVQEKVAQLKACTPDSTDATCKNADKKIAVLTRVDARLQKAIAKVQDWLNGTTTSSDSTSDSSLDAAAGSLAAAAAAAGSNGG